MRFVNFLFKFLFYFILGALTGSLILLLGLSYFGIEHLTQVSDQKGNSEKTESEHHLLNTNILSVLRFGDQYAIELNEFDELQKQILQQKKAIEICPLLCGPSTFESERMLTERTPYLKEFYQQNSLQALKDPVFLLKLKEMNFLSQLFPASFRQIWTEVARHRKKNIPVSRKLQWSWQFTRAFLQEGWNAVQNWRDIKQSHLKIQNLRALFQECQQGARSAKDLRQSCEQM